MIQQTNRSDRRGNARKLLCDKGFRVFFKRFKPEACGFGLSIPTVDGTAEKCWRTAVLGGVKVLWRNGFRVRRK